MTSMSVVRRATHADIDALCRLYPLFLDSQFAMEPFARPNPAFDVRAYVLGRFNDPSFAIFVAEVSGQVVGFSDCSVRPTQGRPPVEYRGVRPFVRSMARRLLWTPPNSYVLPFVEGYLHNSFVHADFRGHRLGFELSRVRVEELRSRGAERIRVHTFVHNERAQHVFTSNGFRPMMLLMEWDAQAAEQDEN